MNHFIFSNNGNEYIIRGGDDMLKACGVKSGGKLVIMTDETGELVGTGFGSENLLKSVPVVGALRDGSLLKSMRENEPLHKYKPQYRIKKPLTKSLTHRQFAGSLGQLTRELEQLKRQLLA